MITSDYFSTRPPLPPSAREFEEFDITRLSEDAFAEAIQNNTQTVTINDWSSYEEPEEALRDKIKRDLTRGINIAKENLIKGIDVFNESSVKDRIVIAAVCFFLIILIIISSLVNQSNNST
jgi:hypothetical protein